MANGKKIAALLVLVMPIGGLWGIVNFFGFLILADEFKKTLQGSRKRVLCIILRVAGVLSLITAVMPAVILENGILCLLYILHGIMTGWLNYMVANCGAKPPDFRKMLGILYIVFCVALIALYGLRGILALQGLVHVPIEQLQQYGKLYTAASWIDGLRCLVGLVIAVVTYCRPLQTEHASVSGIKKWQD